MRGGKLIPFGDGGEGDGKSATGRLDSAPVADSLVIPARFNGPPDSGHGGYSAGLLGTLVDGPAEAALRAPPPLETPLVVEHDGDTVRAMRDGAVVLEAAPASLAVEVPAPVAIEAARTAEADSRFRDADWHPFPTCFACGPRRAEGDGLRLFPGRVSGRDLFATVWVPAAEFGRGGDVEPLLVWAALDCPSSAPAMGGQTIVLASLAVDIAAAVKVGEPHVIASWEIEHDGRKHHSGVALWDARGGVCAVGRALWIELRQSK